LSSPNSLDIRPAEVRRLVGTLIRRGEIAEAYRVLGEKKDQLTTDLLTELARQGANELATRLETSKTLASDMKRLQEVQTRAQRLGDQYVDLALTALNKWLEYLQLIQDLDSINEFGKRGNWKEASAIARTQVRQTDLPPPVKKAVEELVQVGERTLGLEQLQTALKTAEKNHPAETASILRPMNVDTFSSPLRDSVRSWRGMTEIMAAASRKEQAAPYVAGFKQYFADLEAGSGAHDLALRLQQEMAVKLFLDGFPQAARELLPEKAPASHGVSLLRDLKALVLGQGEVSTWPAVRTSPSAGGSGTAASVLPSGLRNLIPESQWASWNPPARRPASPLNTLDELTALEKPLRDRITAGLQQELNAAQQRRTAALKQVQDLLAQNRQASADDSELFRDLESQLGRKLLAAERILAWQMRRQSQRVTEIAAFLRRFEPEPRPKGSSSPG
jgi:hypothetical protein